ncbi:Vacuolar protein sorting associated protein 11 [Fasciola gigantica]|uniref:Vacuolar protein sorting associated protein 11 n=1 Tax=Fasciola gigantica TaxID=46835 RepID=A0A504YIC4_FASGI|nr:Vacuolar protein sorting associated protein 11 [Fasciola gigantica]
MHVCHTKQQDVLVTIGIDEDNEERLKVWNNAKWFNRPEPPCLRNSSCIPSGQTISPTLLTEQIFFLTKVTCVSVDQTLQLIALGHENGTLQVIRGEITRERSGKRFILHTFSEAVTGLGICAAPAEATGTIGRTRADVSSTDHVSPIVFASTNACTMSFLLGRRDEVQLQNILDQHRGGYSCSTMIKENSVTHFVVADSQAVRFYNWDGRSRCLAAGGNKLAVKAFKQYLVIVRGIKDRYLSADSSVSVHIPPESVDSMDPSDLGTVIVHDYLNHFIAGEFPVPDIISLFVEWDAIYALCEHSDVSQRYSLVCISEKSTQAKLELLFSKKNFQLALDVAKSQNLSREDITHIIWRYADHLYKQKEYDASIKEYVRTIGVLEASFVIQRFLEGGHIAQLAYYLEALSDTNLASSDHLILLLNCYSRLQDKGKINRFVEGPVNPNLDVPAAIHVLRQSGCPDAALKLAQATENSSSEVAILVEDLDDGLGALKSVGTFPFDEALKAVCTHGPLLMERYPKETVTVLENLCAHPEASRINIHHLLRIFINSREGLLRFLQRYVENAKVSEKVAGVTDTLLELVLHEAERLEKTMKKEEEPVDSSMEKQHQSLLELATRLLQNEQLPYDEHKALLVCYQRHFYVGCIYLWKKLKLYDQLIDHYISLDDSGKVLQTCHQYGDALPNLWLLALRYFATKPENSDELQQVVSEIDRHELTPPLIVLQILSDADVNQRCSVGAIRDYLLRHLEAGTDKINAMRKEVQQLREETMRNREVVRNLSSQVKIFQQQKCVLCHQTLEPPSVHFLCDHAYHKTCFDNYAYGDHQCPECGPRNKKLLSEAASAGTGITNSSVNQIVTQLRQALQLAHSTSRIGESDNLSTADPSQPTSPRLTKALAQILAQGGGGFDSTKPRRLRDQSPLSWNSIPMAPLSDRAKLAGSVRSEESIGSMPGFFARTQSGSVTDIKGHSVQHSSAQHVTALAHTGSTGYVSGSSGRPQNEDNQQQKQHKPLSGLPISSFNPFGDSDTEEDNVAGKQQHVTNSDPVLATQSGAQSANKAETYRTPFD